MKKKDLILFTLIFVLVLIVLSLFVENSSLKNEIGENQLAFDAMEDQLETEIFQLESTIDQRDAEIEDLEISIDGKNIVISNLSEKLNNTEKELNDTKEELEAKEASLEEYQQEFEQLGYEIETIEASLNDSIQWLSDNAGMSPDTEYFVPYVENKCVENNELNLACLPFFMERYLEFTYKYEENDKLYSIDEMISNEGGDCEDYSLFLKALLHDLKEYTNARLIAWQEGSGTFTVYTTTTKEWYYEDAVPANLGKLDEFYPVVFCYVTSYSTFLLEGHCIVALPEDEIITEEDLVYLEDSLTFEPQDGQYMGKIGTHFNVCYDGQKNCGTVAGDSIIVITDHDIYQFIDGEWKSLEEYREKADDLKTRLEETIG